MHPCNVTKEFVVDWNFSYNPLLVTQTIKLSTTIQEAEIGASSHLELLK